MIDWGKVFINMITTLIAYGAGPLIFCGIRGNARLRTVRTFCIVYTVIVCVLFQVGYFALGEHGGNIWPAVFWGGIFYKVIKNKMVPPEAAPEVHVDVDRYKESTTLGCDPLTPYYTKKRYQNKDWATIETFLNSTLCGANGEELLFKYRETTTIGRSSTAFEMIYIFDSFKKDGEKYSELYVCDEYDDETTVAPVGYRFAKGLTTQEKPGEKDPDLSSTFPDKKTWDDSLSFSTGNPAASEKSPEGNHHSMVRTPAAQMPETGFCRKCGAKLVPNGRFCSCCGTKIAGGE